MQTTRLHTPVNRSNKQILDLFLPQVHILNLCVILLRLVSQMSLCSGQESVCYRARQSRQWDSNLIRTVGAGVSGPSGKTFGLHMGCGGSEAFLKVAYRSNLYVLALWAEWTLKRWASTLRWSRLCRCVYCTFSHGRATFEVCNRSKGKIYRRKFESSHI